MAKESRKKSFKKLRRNENVLAIDLGGTKLAMAVVNSRGKIEIEKREYVQKELGFNGVIQQISNLASPLVKKYKLKVGAIASAGPLDPRSGTLLNPTNLETHGRKWGVVPLISELKRSLKISIQLENDAAAAALAESWLGAAKKVENLVVVTLGTGLGVGVIANGELVRSGRYLHPEAGHIIISERDRSTRCGCGNFGCAEAMLSGMNFTKKLARKWALANLSGEQLVKKARFGDEKAIGEFRKYGELLGKYLCSLTVLFAPELIVLSGGFSNSSDLFLPQCQEKLLDLMTTRRQGVDLMPKISMSAFQDEASLLGAAYVAHQSKKKRN